MTAASANAYAEAYERRRAALGHTTGKEYWVEFATHYAWRQRVATA